MCAKSDQSQPIGKLSLASSEDWARRLRRGEVAAVHQVRDRVRKILAFQKLGIPAHDRDDLEQEVMTEVWQAVNRSSFDVAAGFWAFVELVTSRRCIDWRRRHRVTLPLQESLRDRRAGPSERILDDERSVIAAEILRQLDPDCSEIVGMRFREGLQYKEIARRIGKTEGAVRVQFHRCIRRARELLLARTNRAPPNDVKHDMG